MVDVIGYVIVALLMISFTYGLLRQIQHTLAIQNANKTDVSNYKRALFGNYIVCISSVLLITKFGVIPKNHKPNELLN